MDSNNDNFSEYSDEDNIDHDYVNPLDDNGSDASGNESEPDVNEEEGILEELEEMELGKLVQAKIRLENEKRLNISKKEKVDRRKIEAKLLERNKDKAKSAPKEFSALIKPKKNFFSEKNRNEEKKIQRDPRFDNMSGELNMDSYKKNFSFVQNKAQEYVSKVKDLQKLKSKKKIKIEDEEYSLMKKQINFVKGWIKTKEYEQTKDHVAKEFKDENKERRNKGLNPVYVKDSVMKKLVQTTVNEQRSDKDTKKYLKRKQHRDIVKTRRNELRI
jgi:ribosomal RNA-processing protein 36